MTYRRFFLAFNIAVLLCFSGAASSLYTYKVENTSAEWLAERIEPLLPVDMRLTFDDRTDTILFLCPEEESELILQAMKSLDQETIRKQVYIETLITETTLDGSRDMGIAWEVRQELQPNSDKNLDTTARISLPAELNPGGTVNIGTLSNDSFTALISAMRIRTDTDVISSPRVVAQSGEEARILVGSRIPYVETVTSENVINRNVRFMETGVRLAVIPTVEGEWVSMKIRPEVSVFTGWSPTDNQPIVSTREADTTVAVKDGSTVVIGGLIRETKESSSSKVPGLGDMPIIGGAFRRRRVDRVKTEMTVFLTPVILKNEVVQHDSLEPAGVELDKGRLDAVRTSVREVRRKMEVEP